MTTDSLRDTMTDHQIYCSCDCGMRVHWEYMVEALEEMIEDGDVDPVTRIWAQEVLKGPG